MVMMTRSNNEIGRGLIVFFGNVEICGQPLLLPLYPGGDPVN